PYGGRVGAGAAGRGRPGSSVRVAIHADGPRVRGNERQAILLARGLVARGHEVLASCRRRGPVRDGLEAAGARTTGVRPRGDADLASALLFAAWLRRHRVRALLVTSWKRAFVAGLAARWAGVPRVVLRLGGLRGSETGPGSRLRRLSLGRWYHGIVVNSPEVGDWLVREMGVPPRKVRVVANGVEPVAAPPAPLRAALGIPADDALVVAVGGLERNKGADLLPGILARQGAGVHLAVAGRGSDARRAELERDAGSLGVAGRLHLLGHRDDVPAVLAAADAFVLPSRMDSMPNAMLEAMSAGLPVVMADVGGVRWALGPRDGRPAAGWIAPVDDPPALAEAVAEVVSDLRAGGTRSRERGAEAAWRAEHWFGVERMVREYQETLSENVERS
ncbi:MAG: glycosyltransferase, partial [Gemmatimonadota bacterium]